MINIKEALYQNCKRFIDDKSETIHQIMNSNQNALLSETKSSAGDKHETGRAMLQLEMEKASQQFSVISNMNEILQKMDIQKKNKIAKLGALIYTNKGNYFLAISMGLVFVMDVEFFVLSPSSPVGKLLLGKKENDEVIFNGNKIRILEIY